MRGTRRTHPTKGIAAACALALLVIALPVAAAPGDLDTTFGTGGKTITNVGTPRQFAHAVAVDPDGNVLVAGTSDGIALAEPSFAVTRFLPEGSLDETFGVDGTRMIDFPGREAAYDLLLQGDGKIVLAGWAGAPPEEDFAIARLTSTGQLDNTFSGDGKQTIDFYGDRDFGSAVGRHEGNYFVAGNVFDPSRQDEQPEGEFEEQENFGLTKLDGSGTILTDTFGTSGRVQTDIGALKGDNASNPDNQDFVADMEIDATGKVVLGGTSEMDNDDFSFTLVRYNGTTGALDPTFDGHDNGNGRVYTMFEQTPGTTRDASIRDIVIHEGTIIATGDADLNTTGNTNGVFALARYLETNGVLDGGFGSGGKVIQPVGRTSGSFGRDRSFAVLVDPAADKITVGGSDSGLDFAMARFNSNGTLDTSAPGSGTEFGMGGIVVNDLGGDGQMGDEIFDMAFDPTSGKLVVSGVGGPLGNAVAARYSTKGLLDSDSDVDPGAAFGANGFVTTIWGGNDYDYAEDLIQLADGDFLAAGHGYYGGPTALATIVYDPEGNLRQNYGVGGIARTYVAGVSSNEPVTALEMEDGRVLLVTSGIQTGQSGRDVVLVRLEENGDRDPSFGTNGVKRIPLVVNGDDTAADALLQEDGKIVIAATVNNNDIALLRVHPDGSFDTDSDSDPGVHFSNDGFLIEEIYNSGGAKVDQATALEAAGTDLLLGAKRSPSNGQNNFAVLRFSSSGVRDMTFGTNGFALADFTEDFNNHDVINDLLVQNDGKIVAVGRTGQFDFDGGFEDIALARFNTDGTLDTANDITPASSFDTDGWLTTDINNTDLANAGVLLPDGRILALGRTLVPPSQQQTALVMYSPGGSLDPDFGTGGKQMLADQAGEDVLLQDDDKAVIFGLHMLVSADIFDFLLERISLGPGTPVVGRSLTLNSNKQKIVFGSNVKLSGTVSSTDADCKFGVGVTITPSPGAERVATTSGTGAYSINLSPKEKTTYFAGVPPEDGCAAAEAGPKVVKVAKKVTLNSSAAKVEKGKSVTLTAQLAPCPGKQGQDMTLKKKTGGSFRKVGTKEVNGQCKATWTQTINAPTTFQATSPKQDQKHEGGTSAPEKVKLK